MDCIKSTIFFIIFLCTVSNLNGQTIEGKVRLGYATSRFKSNPIGAHKTNVFAAKPLTDITLVLQTKIQLSEKLKLNYLLGIDFGNTRGYWPIIGWGNKSMLNDSRHLENLVYNKQRISIRWLGLEKKISLIAEKLWISANITFLSRFYLGNEKKYTADYKFNNEDWIEYQYDFRLYHNKVYDSDVQLNFFDLYLNTEYGLQIGGTINEKISWNFNVAHYRNLYNYYNFNLDIKYYYSGESEPHTTYKNAWDQSLDSEKLIQRENYIAIGVGMQINL